jgi:hypothetical protein
LSLFEDGTRTPKKQERHTMEAAILVEHDLKQSLLGMAHALFGEGMFGWIGNWECVSFCSKFLHLIHYTRLGQTFFITCFSSFS